MDYLEKITLKKESTDFERVNIKSSKDSSRYIRKFYDDDIEIYESCFILLLNKKNDTIGYAKISQGGVSGTVVDLKIILKYAVESLASAIILAHNHPSGNTKPSKADINLTERVKESLGLFDCMLLDHIILTKEDSYSFADNELI